MKEYQTLQQLINAETPHVRIATEKDNESILKFYHQSAMSDKNQSIKYGRGNDFFTFLKDRSDQFLVLTIWDDQNAIQGVGVISYRNGFINNELTTIGYLGDLRVNLNKKLIREWRKLYSLLMKYSAYLPETFYCKYYQTVIIDQNTKAKSTLVETKIPNLKYELLEKYKMINVIGKINLPTNQLFSIAPMQENEKDSIQNFLFNFDRQRNFGRDWNHELDFRLTRWKNFTNKSIHVIKDSNQKIMAITSSWNPIESKQVMVTNIPLIFKILVPLLNFFPLVQIKPLPKKDRPIDILYLNQFVFDPGLSLSDKKNIVSQVINYLFKENFSMLAYADFESQSLLENNKQFITNTIQMSMYTVHSLNENNQIIDPIPKTTNQDPGFDMVLV